MADIKISQLGAAIAVNDSDLLPIVSNGNTLKAPASLVKDYAVGNTDLSGIGDGTPTGAIAALNTAKQPKTLDTPLTIGGVQKTNVEGALGGLNSELDATKQALTTLTTDIAPVEDGTNYSKTYYINDRFIRDGVLYVVTVASVNTSTAIVVGGNCARDDSVTTHIKKITDKIDEYGLFVGYGTVYVEGNGSKTFSQLFVELMQALSTWATSNPLIKIKPVRIVVQGVGQYNAENLVDAYQGSAPTELNFQSFLAGVSSIQMARLFVSTTQANNIYLITTASTSVSAQNKTNDVLENGKRIHMYFEKYNAYIN